MSKAKLFELLADKIEIREKGVPVERLPQSKDVARRYGFIIFSSYAYHI